MTDPRLQASISAHIQDLQDWAAVEHGMLQALIKTIAASGDPVGAHLDDITALRDQELPSVSSFLQRTPPNLGGLSTATLLVQRYCDLSHSLTMIRADYLNLVSADKRQVGDNFEQWRTWRKEGEQRLADANVLMAANQPSPRNIAGISSGGIPKSPTPIPTVVGQIAASTDPKSLDTAAEFAFEVVGEWEKASQVPDARDLKALASAVSGAYTRLLATAIGQPVGSVAAEDVARTTQAATRLDATFGRLQELGATVEIENLDLEL